MRYRWLVVTALVLLALGHLGLAMLRTPLPAASGNQIHAPGNWRDPDIDTIRVSTFNIHRGKGMDDERDLERATSLLLKDDIAGLQEVRGPLWYGGKDQAEQIAEIAGTGWLFAPIQKQYYKDYLGNALLSQFAVHDWKRIPLVHTDTLDLMDRSRRYRNLIEARTMINGKEVTLLVTHLDRGDIRQTQLAQLLARFDQSEAAILMADLNTTSEDPVMAAWLQANPDTDAVGIALGETDYKNRIDWILAKGFDVLDGGYVNDGTSDHPYFWVELRAP